MAKLVQVYSSGTPMVSVNPFDKNTPATAATAAATSRVTPAGWNTRNYRRFIYDEAGHLLGEYDATSGYSQETVWFNGQPVATVQGGVVYYINADHLGTPRSIVRSSDGAEVWTFGGEPFGASGGGGSIVYNLRFPGQYADTEAAWSYNGARNYDPHTGRYLEADPMGLTAGVSRYNYLIRHMPQQRVWRRRGKAGSVPRHTASGEGWSAGRSAG